MDIRTGSVTAEPKRSSTGIPGLDEVLHGGLIAEQLYLVDGAPGAGKTTFALQYLREGARNGEKCTYVTLSETKRELEAGALSHGWSLDGIDIIELVPDEEALRGEEQLTMLPVAEVELGETMRKVLEAIELSGPSRMVFDSLSELRLLAQNSLRYRRQILALKQYFVGRHCTVIMIDDRTGEASDLRLHSIAHGVIALNSSVPTYGQTRREMQVIKFRGSDFISGFHDFSIRRGGLVIYPRLVAAHHSTPYPQEILKSGIGAFDDLMGGGIDRGTSTLLVGPPGSGKSTLALQCAAAAVARGDHAVLFAFDETKSALLVRSASIGLKVIEGSGPGQIALLQVDPVAISPGEFAHMVSDAVERDGARIVVIDSLNGYLNAMPRDNYLTAQLHELLSYLNHRGVTTFLTVAQSGMIGVNMTSPIDASYLADSVVLLRYFEFEGTVRKSISVIKKRTGGHEGSIRELWFNSHGIQLSEPLLWLRGVLTGGPTESPGAKDPNERAQSGHAI